MSLLNKDELLALLPDNTSGAISPADVREIVENVFNAYGGIGANPTDRNLLADWLDFQSRTAFVMADLNAAPFPFDAYGDLASGALTWPQMAQNHPGHKLRIQHGEMARLDSVNPSLFRARVSWTVEIDVGGI